MWEETKGYPANKENDCRMKFSVHPEGCQIVLEEVESLTQHAPHLVPIFREGMFQVSVFCFIFLVMTRHFYMVSLTSSLNILEYTH